MFSRSSQAGTHKVVAKSVPASEEAYLLFLRVS